MVKSVGECSVISALLEEVAAQIIFPSEPVIKVIPSAALVNPEFLMLSRCSHGTTKQSRYTRGDGPAMDWA
jgi:hypothetical protein